MLIGLLIIFLLIINILDLKLRLAFKSFQTVWVVVFVILFQPEIRRLLTSVGQNRILRKLFQIERTEIQEDILSSIEEIKRNKWGALLVFEREKFKNVVSDAVPMHASFSPELLVSI